MDNTARRSLSCIGLSCALALAASGADGVLQTAAVGWTDATPAIQAEVDRISRAGGGRLTVPKGEYVINGLELKSGVELHLEEGAALLSATNLEAYALSLIHI